MNQKKDNLIEHKAFCGGKKRDCAAHLKKN
jgi:hypothetical protein